jgi:hypothetical protein
VSRESLRARLAKSAFRSKFKLSARDAEYFRRKGADAIRSHAEAVIRERLGPANQKNDGRQTPFKGHPVFTAQHATGTCCRSCLEKWHGVKKGKALTDSEAALASDAIMAWLEERIPSSGAGDPPRAPA